MSKKILSVVIALVVVFAMFIPMTASAAVVTPVADAAEFNTVVDSWYVAANGGFKFNVDTWLYYGSYGITLVQSTALPTSCLTVAIYAADSDEVFAAKTQADFEAVLGETAEVFEARTIGNSDFPMYYCKTATYENYVFQAHGQKYFINFINAGDKAELAAFAEKVMASIVIADDPANVIYYVDGVEYAREAYEAGATITTIVEPTKDGYTFSGWSEIPEVMGDENVIVTGTFTANNPETGDNTAIITIGAIAVLAFVAIVASKKRATSK